MYLTVGHLMCELSIAQVKEKQIKMKKAIMTFSYF